ncbi:MAG TPA: hypothetical protein VMR33_02465 [Candidatus Baltobacteraceae bacterium]|jgi:hypothetical protein|nr:hypothetical protein [Candidatus Baltobacteraceae bacterium]
MKPLTLILITLLLAGGSVGASAQETNAPPGQDFSSFDIIARKNIFDQSRIGVSALGSRRRQPRIERITLLAIGVDPTHGEAYFGGNDAPERFLKIGDHVDGFELSRITPDCVRLTNASNTFVLDMDDRRSLRRVDGGPWEGSSDQADPVDIATNSADDTAAAPAASAEAPHPGESAIERKLRLRREQEEK